MSTGPTSVITVFERASLREFALLRRSTAWLVVTQMRAHLRLWVDPLLRAECLSAGRRKGPSSTPVDLPQARTFVSVQALIGDGRSEQSPDDGRCRTVVRDDDAGLDGFQDLMAHGRSSLRVPGMLVLSVRVGDEDDLADDGVGFGQLDGFANAGEGQAGGDLWAQDPVGQ